MLAQRSELPAAQIGKAVMTEFERLAWHNEQTAANLSAPWTDWHELSDVTSRGSTLALAAHPDGRVHAVMAGTDRLLLEPDRIVITSGIPDIEGWVEIALHRDGTVNFRGHVHNGGVESFGFRLRVSVRTSTVAVALVYEGHVGGWQIGSGNPSDEDWDQGYQNYFVRLAFDRFRDSSLEVEAETRGDLTGWIEDAATFLARFIITGVLTEGGIFVDNTFGGRDLFLR
jgi:hypothetical protein